MNSVVYRPSLRGMSEQPGRSGDAVDVGRQCAKDGGSGSPEPGSAWQTAE